MADMEKIYDDLIIIDLYNTFFVLRTPGHLETNDVTGVPLVRMWKIAFDDSFTDCAACTKG
jgi:hypothetical protein